MRNCIIMDIDGTMADLSHRLHHLKKPKNYDAFHAKVYFDKPTACVPLARILQYYDNADLVCVSGRPEKARLDTINWLNLHGVFPKFLFMRKDGDYREDSVIKEEMLQEMRSVYGLNPILVIDDRPRVVEMWRKNNIPTIHIHVDEWYESAASYATLGKTLLYLMVGPSGGGKSYYVSENSVWHDVPEWYLLSSDAFRAKLCGDFRDQSKNDQVFSAMRATAVAFMQHDIPVLWDATNIRRKDRVSAAKLVPKGARCRYIVVDRPLSEKHRNAKWRDEVIVKGKKLIDYHHEIFQQNLPSILRGDDLPFVDVKDERRT